jgi:hypothetical protein
MIRSILLIVSIVIISILLVAIAYTLRNPSICCQFEICQRFTNLCEEREEEFVLSTLRGEEMYLDNISPNDFVEMGSEINGRITGTWYFEGEFPIRVMDSNGEILDTLIAVAQEEWMTEDLVPFSFVLDVNIQADRDVILRFERNNPTGLEEHDDSLEVPITILVSEEQIVVLAFFPNEQRGSTEDCSLVFPLSRNVPDTLAVGRASLRELIDGLTANERQQGYFTNINENVEIRRLVIEEGVALVDFSSELEEGVGGSCMVTSIRAQIEETLKQFPTVDSVVISIEGRTEDILQP